MGFSWHGGIFTRKIYIIVLAAMLVVVAREMYVSWLYCFALSLTLSLLRSRSLYLFIYFSLSYGFFFLDKKHLLAIYCMCVYVDVGKIVHTPVGIAADCAFYART